MYNSVVRDSSPVARDQLEESNKQTSHRNKAYKLHIVLDEL